MTGQKRGRGKLVAERRYKATNKTSPKPKAKRTTTKKARRAPKRKSTQPFVVRVVVGFVRWGLRMLWIIPSRTALVVALILGLSVGYIYTTLPPVTDLLDGRARGSVTLLDRNGSIFAWRGEQFGGQITADTMSPHLKNAIVATEDRRFYKHFGVSPRGIASAIKFPL